MKKFLMTISMLMFGGLSLAAADGAQAPDEREVMVAINEAFVPGGFDINSEVFVVASGIFPNGCYRWKGAEVNAPTSTLHEIKAMATVKQGMCLMVLVPFNKEIRLGKFVQGEHTLRFLNGDGTFLEKKIVIE